MSTGGAVPGLQVRLTSTLGEVLEPSVEIPTTENTVTDTGLQFSQLGPAPAGMCSCTASECNYY